MGKEERRDCSKKEFRFEETSTMIKNNIKDYRRKRNIFDEEFDVKENINKLLEDINTYMGKLEKEKDNKVELNLDEITKDINKKLSKLDDQKEDELEKTLYDLSEISSMIKKTIDKLEKDKEKKRKKAMYCDQARKNNYKKYKRNKK